MSLGHLSQVTLTKGTKLDVPAPLMKVKKKRIGFPKVLFKKHFSVEMMMVHKSGLSTRSWDIDSKVNDMMYKCNGKMEAFLGSQW